MSRRLQRLLIAWEVLLAALAAEIAISYLTPSPSTRLFVLAPAAAMIIILGAVFMEAMRGPTAIRLYIGAGILWLCILLGLGSLDPMTRVNHYIQTVPFK